MFITKVYLYDSSQEENGYRGEDFSKHVLQGDQEQEDITQELDTAEITLAGLTRKKEFDPQTKFIVDLVNKTDIEEEIIETRHWVVGTDAVEQPILSDNNYFNHHISLIEPSVVAQQRLVDNISATYKLKDVTLEQTLFFKQQELSTQISSSAFTPKENFGIVESFNIITGRRLTCVTGKYFELEGEVEIFKPNGERIYNLYTNIEDFFNGETYTFSVKFPKIAIYYGVDGTKEFDKIGYASIGYRILECEPNNENVITNEIKGSIISNSDLGAGMSIENATFKWNDTINGEWLLEKGDYDRPALSKVESFVGYYKKYTDKLAQEPNYFISNIPIQKDKKYIIEFYLYQFEDVLNSNNSKKYLGDEPSYYIKTSGKVLSYMVVGGGSVLTYRSENFYLTPNQVTANSKLITYSDQTGTIVYSSSTPYSALALLQKAIINSSIYEKKDGVYIADVNNSDLPFYIDPNFESLLMSTQIIENFYNQKNLWEIMLEVGHYIHSIPELRFGKDDKFEITFNELGRTDEKLDNSTKVSILNSRNVEEYVSATSSYIENMVQLGGYIEEWVVPKTTNEQLLVYNDTAEIIVSKPIIELLSIKVKNNITNEIADLTPYIYEENVYKTLSLDYSIIPNRGIAMYYSLGNNVITGGQFQLPQSSSNIYSDYSFKKVIWSAFNGYPIRPDLPVGAYWTELEIQDYSFFVQYRTKDSVRQNHIRPDLRKYLLNSKHDKYPEHNQFNNQTDIVVDSLKFGNNMFGKLIKTGNSSYEIYEWNDDYENVKHKGELYRINGELYYVAKVLHIHYSSYILSKVTYSKDYNELSAVVGIPSEPRFYEISEQSLIRREIAINDMLLLTDDIEQTKQGGNYLLNMEHLSNLVLGEGVGFSKYALTVFKGDKDADKYSQTVGEKDFYKELLSPINAYSSENTLTYEWDMLDNYSAGDKVVSTEKVNYSSLEAVKYTDIHGRSALMDFYILEKIDNYITSDFYDMTIKNLPESPIKTTNPDDYNNFVGNFNIVATNVKEFDTNFNGRGIGLLKDCREALSINYNLQLVTNSDTFVLSPHIFLPNKTGLKVVLLAEEVNKFSAGYINNSAIITPFDIDENAMNAYFDFEVSQFLRPNPWDASKDVVAAFGLKLNEILRKVADEHFVDTENFQRVKSIAVLCNVPTNPSGVEQISPTIPNKTQFVFARNIPSGWTKEEATRDVFFGTPNKDKLFKNKQ